MKDMLKVLFTTDIPIYSTNSYFICGSSYLQFGSQQLNSNGSRTTITISGVGNYPGFIQNGTSGSAGYSNISIYNLIINSSASSLLGSSGWLCQTNYGRAAINNIIANCSSNGEVSSHGGGIAGAYTCADNATLTIQGCSSTGSIFLSAGGIVGETCAIGPGDILTIERCWSSGAIDINSGGITGNSCGINGGVISCANCYSTGVIGNSSGGIFGVTNGSNGTATATNCYSLGYIGSGCGGIFGGNAGLAGGLATAINCYSSGAIQSSAGGIFGGGYVTTSANHCYTSGVMSSANGGIWADSNYIGPTNYAEGVNANIGWNDTNAAVTLTGAPSTSLYGTTWTTVNGINTPYVLSFMGYSPYSLSLTTTANYSLVAGNSTPSPVVSGYTYSIIAINNVPPIDNITINSSTGIITANASTSGGTYTIIVYSSINPYSITVYTLHVTSAPPVTQTIPTMCCMPDNKMNGLCYPTINDLTIGNNVSRDIARCTPHLPLPSYSFYYSFVNKNNFNK